MSEKGAKEKGEEEAKADGQQGFAEMCRQMMSGKPPDCCGAETQGIASGETLGCCGPEMRAMMSRIMAAF